MKKFGSVKKETWAEIFFLLFLFCFYFMWARIQPLSASPDEQMRYQIAEYIYENGSLPRGDDPAVRNPVWGISYAFNPILPYMIGAFFMKLVSLVTVSPFALLMAARMVSIFCGVGTAFIARRIGGKLFSAHKAWMMTVFVCMLPEAVLIFSYVNCDSMAIFSSALIIYAWICGMESCWSYRACLLLAVGVGLCGMSYYNAYGFIICSILLFGSTLLLDAQKRGKPFFVKRGALVCVVVLAIVGWWFVRNAILYDGDFMARAASSACAEKYARAGFKPSDRMIPSREGMTFWEMLTQGFQGTTVPWMELVARSFIGRFGHFDVILPAWIEDNYMDFIKAGFLLVFLHPVRTFALKDKKGFLKQGIFNWCMMLALVIPNVLSAWYSYSSDYQPQGRYSLPMLLPLGYFLVMGYGNVFDQIIENTAVRNRVYKGICFLMAALVIYVYFTVFWPAYRDVPFGLGALIMG